MLEGYVGGKLVVEMEASKRWPLRVPLRNMSACRRAPAHPCPIQCTVQTQSRPSSSPAWLWPQAAHASPHSPPSDPSYPLSLF